MTAAIALVAGAALVLALLSLIIASAAAHQVQQLARARGPLQQDHHITARQPGSSSRPSPRQASDGLPMH